VLFEENSNRHFHSRICLSLNFSNGQNQRLILAKILYWLDDEIDVVVLDECTSGLDDKSETDSADAERILKYIVDFCNKDKKRIVIISTHQNLEGFKKKLTNPVKQFHFAKDGECNLITEI
jgi:ABC-type transport system involved in cytochrome bd biosynthesis fused ATPase/permease subunit